MDFLTLRLNTSACLHTHNLGIQRPTNQIKLRSPQLKPQKCKAIICAAKTSVLISILKTVLLNCWHKSTEATCTFVKRSFKWRMLVTTCVRLSRLTESISRWLSVHIHDIVHGWRPEMTSVHTVDNRLQTLCRTFTICWKQSF